ncbi:MAG TPA: glycogen/starch/alpha-glucan phosphorylase, partial [Bacillota bacterium]|nr:glycogen/starch/alpha-glucan phosphorylase [Bacillota bacterium]
IDECIGPDYKKQPEKLEEVGKFADDTAVLDRLAAIKRDNKKRLSDMCFLHTGIRIDPDSVYDVQAKRLHEYKRQLLNVLGIVSLYVTLRENPSLEITPRTFLFGAKAAPGYYHAKEVIKLICAISAHIEKDPVIRRKMRVMFLENYNVSMAECLMPAADISEQISLAGKEASGTGNMKFMINGALTVGTLDGANVEIHNAVGDENMYLFGLTTEEVDALWRSGYESSVYYNRSDTLRKAIDMLNTGFNGESFSSMVNYLLFARGVADPYMCMADFDEYQKAKQTAFTEYDDRRLWNKKCLINISKAGVFAADRSIREYADNIWHIKPVR